MPSEDVIHSVWFRIACRSSRRATSEREAFGGPLSIAFLRRREGEILLKPDLDRFKHHEERAETQKWHDPPRSEPERDACTKAKAQA